MASNLKAVTGLLKDNLLGITFKALPEDHLDDIFKQKDNDTADIMKERAIYAIQKGIASSESDVRNNADIIRYLTENDLYTVYTDAAEQLIDKNNADNGKDLLSGYFANPAPQAKLNENPGIKLHLDFLLQKSDFQHIASELHLELNSFQKGQDPKKIKDLMSKLDNIDKLLSQNFSNIAATLNLADKVDNLRVEISTLLIRARIRLIEQSKDDRNIKQKEFAALVQGHKEALQKKPAFFQSRLQKINEIIPNLQSKILINVNKLKNADLTKCIQLYLKFNNEIIKLDEGLQDSFRNYAKAGGRGGILASNILNQQRNLIDKISRLEQYTGILNAKAPPQLLKEVKDLLIFYEELAYLQNTLNRFKNFLQEDTEDLSSILSQLRNRESRSRSPFLYRADKMNYRGVRYYLDNFLAEDSHAVLYLDAKAGVTASIYVLPEEISFYGIVKVDAEKYSGDNIKLTFSGYSGYRADSIAGTEEYSSSAKLNTKAGFILNDSDDASKFILSGFKKFDFFNRLQNVKPLEKV